MVLSTAAAWVPFENGATLGKVGSEGGSIIREERHTDGARICLERLSKRRFLRSPIVSYAITCGIFGWMVHTRFFDTAEDASVDYEAMKSEIVSILERLPLENDPLVEERMKPIPDLLYAFVEKFP